MRVWLKKEGGLAYFPGLNAPLEVDAAALSPADAQTLDQLVRAARLDHRPPVVGSLGKGAADYRQYVLTVEDAGTRRTVKILEPVSDTELSALIQWLEARRGGG